MKTSAEPIPVVVVGGGSILLARTRSPAPRELVKPEHFAVANAIGAAIAQIGGEVDKRLRARRHDPRRGARGGQGGGDREGGRGRRRAATPSEIVDVEEVPLAYLAGQRDADPGEGGRRPRRSGGWALRLVGEAELEDIAVGAAILGTGGGGDPVHRQAARAAGVRALRPGADGRPSTRSRTTPSSSPRR